MTTASNPEEGDPEYENQRPRDWRRRRRSERSSPATEASQPDARPRVEDSDQELSQPLITFFEPFLDQIAIYSGPLILAGVVGLVTGIAVVAFISSMRLYGVIDIAMGR